MTLVSAPVLYVFFDVYGVSRERAALERALGLSVVEVEPHQPHERHGVVKYDAGNLILSLNWSSQSKFKAYKSDAFVTVLDVASDSIDTAALGEFGTLAADPSGIRFTDPSGHHFVLRPGRSTETPAVAELRLTVDDLDESLAFYRDVLGLELIAHESTARFATGSVPLVLVEGRRAPDGREPQRRTVLIVFYTADVNSTYSAMEARGLRFDNLRPYFTDIGGTVRFIDPSGHRFCLYEPSTECLTWGSGPKVLDIVQESVSKEKSCSRTPV